MLGDERSSVIVMSTAALASAKMTAYKEDTRLASIATLRFENDFGKIEEIGGHHCGARV
jgi:hypothetical protein